MSEIEQIEALFRGADATVRATYEQILTALEAIGPFQIEPKKTSIHLVRVSGFAGIHPRKRSLTLNLRTSQPIQSTRIAKLEQISKQRFHNELKLEHPEDIDAELIDWLREAYLT